MAIINASQELGDYANIVAKAQIPTDVKQIVCDILAGRGVFNPLEGLSVCLNVAIGDLLSDAGLGSASSALEEALNDLETGLNEFVEHTGVNNALGRINNAMNQVAAIYSMVNFCAEPMTAPNINTSLSNVIGSYTGAGKAILDALGAIGDSNISACVDGNGNFNFNALDPSSLLARIKNALDVGDPLGDFVAEVRNTISQFRNLIDQENNGDAPSARVVRALSTANILKATFNQASSYKVDEVNGLFDFFVDGSVIDALNNPPDFNALVQQRVPVYDYCGNLTGYQIVDLQGNSTTEGPSTDPATNHGATTGGQVFGAGAGPDDKTLGGGASSGTAGGTTSGVSGNTFPTTLFVENLDIDNTFNAGSGLVAKIGNTPVNISITGASQQVNVSNGDGQAGNPLIGLANNPIVPGTASLTVPVGATGDRGASTSGGQIRYNTDTNKFEIYLLGQSWHEILTDIDLTNINNQFTALSNTYALKTELSTGANVGGGNGTIFRDKTSNTINFKTLIGGTGITITNNTDDIVITSNATGSIETIANVGSGEGIFKDVTGTTANLKTLIAGDGITITSSTDAITVASTEQYLLKANAQTTDAAAVTVPFGLQIPTDYSWFFTATFLGRRQGGIVERNAFKLEGVVDNTSGTVGLVGPAAYTIYQNNAQQWNVTVETSGTALIFKVYGEAGKTINWTGHVRFQPTGENFTYV